MKILASRSISPPTIGLSILLIAIGLVMSPAAILASYSEDEISIESWMLTPFDQAFEESELVLESWMAAPFEVTIEETDPVLETWMAIPFSQAFGESELLVESWMDDGWF